MCLELFLSEYIMSNNIMLIQYFRLYRMWLELLEFCFFSFLIMQFVRLVLADADLTLLWKEKFGKKPGILYPFDYVINCAEINKGTNLPKKKLFSYVFVFMFPDKQI